MNPLFLLTETQWNLVWDWISSQRRVHPSKTGAIGGDVSFCFTPTSLGMVIQVKHVGGGTLDISDYDSF